MFDGPNKVGGSLGYGDTAVCSTNEINRIRAPDVNLDQSGHLDVIYTRFLPFPFYSVPACLVFATGPLE